MKTITKLFSIGMLCMTLSTAPLAQETLVSVTLDATGGIKVPVGENPIEVLDLLFLQEGGTLADDRVYIEEFGITKNILFGEAFDPTKPVTVVIENPRGRESVRTTCPPLLPTRLNADALAEFPWIFLPDSYFLVLDANGRLSCKIISK